MSSVKDWDDTRRDIERELDEAEAERQSRQKCEVRDGRFVEPCGALYENTDNGAPGFSRVKGIFYRRLFNRTTHQPSRSMFGVMSKAYPKGGYLFNYCPFCGADISEPFQDHDEPSNTGETA